MRMCCARCRCLPNTLPCRADAGLTCCSGTGRPAREQAACRGVARGLLTCNAPGRCRPRMCWCIAGTFARELEAWASCLRLLAAAVCVVAGASGHPPPPPAPAPPRPLQVPGQNHRDPWFADFYKKCLQDLKLIFGTKEGTTIIFPGEQQPPTAVHPPLLTLLRCAAASGCRPPQSRGACARDTHPPSGCPPNPAPLFFRRHRHWRLGVGADQHALTRRQGGDLPLRAVQPPVD